MVSQSASLVNQGRSAGCVLYPAEIFGTEDACGDRPCLKTGVYREKKRAVHIRRIVRFMLFGSEPGGSDEERTLPRRIPFASYREGSHARFRRKRLVFLPDFRYDETERKALQRRSAMRSFDHFSAPGRVEIGGNHTDHQHGTVLAAAIDLATEADVQENGENVIRVVSEGYAPVEISLSDLAARPEERNTTAALVRGVAAGFADRGCMLRGFDAAVRSTVLPGSGLSSSAAFEVLLGKILNALCFDGRLDAVEIAKIGRYAENVYFGKPCGLMDQTASAVGGLVLIDFADPVQPRVQRIPYDISRSGYALCVVDSGADHAGLTEEYAAIPAEMHAVAACFQKTFLREVDEAAFYRSLPAVRRAAGDRAALRAMHFFSENRRAREEADALLRDDFSAFLALVNASGLSSALALQNITPAGETRSQALALTLALCRKLLNGEGACRVHGGGFAGTALAFVPNERLDGFMAGLRDVLGAGCCRVLKCLASAE